jgi:hypothetical protein
MADDMTPTELVRQEIDQTERRLASVGKFGVLLVVLSLIICIAFLVNLRAFPNPSSRELELIVMCIVLIAVVGVSGIVFTRIAEYREAIHAWKEQSLKDYEARHR